jgi:hypothetical protein
MAALALAATLGLLTLGARRVAAEGYYVASICNPANPTSTTEGSYFSEGANFINASSTTTTRARCGLPHDTSLGDITFQFMVKRNGTGTTSCAGFARDSAGNVVWASGNTTHNSDNSGGFSIVSTNNGPAGLDTYTYATHCSLAPSHKLERLRLY